MPDLTWAKSVQKCTVYNKGTYDTFGAYSMYKSVLIHI